MLAETLGYTLWSASTVGMFVWLIALWAGVVLSGLDARLADAWRSLARGARARPAAWQATGRALASVAALALAALAGGVGAAAGQADEHAFEFAALGTLNARMGAVPRGHSVYLNARLDGLITPLRPELTYDLRRRGVRALGVGAYLRTGHWYERAEHTYDYVVWVYDNGRLPVPGARVIADARIRCGGREHTVEVALSHVPARAARAGPAPARAAPARAATALALAPHPGRRWSGPSQLGRCALAAPAVVFPSSAPSIPSGPGAVVWASRCAPAATPVWTLSLAELDGGRARAARSRAVSGASPASLQAVGGSGARITAAAAEPDAAFVLLQGRAGAGPGVSVALHGAATAAALARAYLGDAALATVTEAPALEVRVQRYFLGSFTARQAVPIPAGPVTALTATMDYRSDVLLAWQQGGYIYAHMVRASGRADPTQRLGPSAPHPQLRALVSDNDHGMVAWSTAQAGPGGAPRTSVFVDLSEPGVRFGAPARLASFADPGLVGRSPGSLALVRLSSENVLLAWTARERGRYVVRAAPAVYAATRPSALVSDVRTQAVLSDLAAGPAGEAIAVWRASEGPAFDPHRAALWAARAFILRHDRPGVALAEQLAPPGSNGAASVGVDPASDRAVVAWLAGAGAQPAVDYASAPGASGYRPRPASAARVRSAAGVHWLRITLLTLAALAALAATGVLLRRRRRQPVSYSRRPRAGGRRRAGGEAARRHRRTRAARRARRRRCSAGGGARRRVWLWRARAARRRSRECAVCATGSADTAVLRAGRRPSTRTGCGT
jgi:hypothetical protein